MTELEAAELGRTDPGSESEGSELVAALEFLESASSWVDARPFDLGSWIDRHLVRAGRMSLPPSGPGDAGVAVLVARARVVDTLRGFRAVPADDRFMTAAIFAGRVRRVHVGGERRWAARPAAGDSLSTIVLSLFAVDILSHRERYEASLSVCEICGGVSFDDATEMRFRCREHASHVVRVSAPFRAPVPRGR